MATRAALKLADYVVTEAGFGADLGAEKFFDIKCRKAGLKPAATVLVATVRALKMHGGVAKDALGGGEHSGARGRPREPRPAYRQSAKVRSAGRRRHKSVRHRHEGRTRIRREAVAREFAVKTIVCDHWARGRGAEALAHAVAALADAGEAKFRTLYPRRNEFMGQDANNRARDLWRRRHRRRSLGASEIRRARGGGLGRLPVCVAKTQYSFSDDPSLMGAPSGHVPRIQDVRLRAGAGFVVVLMGDIRTMPGLPRIPAAERIRVVNGEIDGLF